MSFQEVSPVHGIAVPGEGFDLRQRSNLLDLDRQLYRHWNLGRNFTLAWCPEGAAILVLVVPHFAVADYVNADVNGVAADAAQEFITDLLSGPRQFTGRQIQNAARLLGTEPCRINLRQPLGDGPGEAAAVESLVKRYSVSYARSRAVALFDIVGFGLLSPFEQMTQLNSLSCSLNAAHSQLLGRRLMVNFARSTTGDGFYIWNRDTGTEANTNLYHFMHLVLADNAIARAKARGRTVPMLRSCFHVGGCYEFQHAEGLNPTLYSDIVGDVTIALARMIDSAAPGQILVGDFHVPGAGAGRDGALLDAVGFIELAQHSLGQLSGLELSGDAIESIKCYLTGRARPDGTFTIRKLAIHDKHGLTRHVFNAKVNIHRRDGNPILLGIEDRQLRDDAAFGITAAHLVRESLATLATRPS